MFNITLYCNPLKPLNLKVHFLSHHENVPVVKLGEPQGHSRRLSCVIHSLEASCSLKSTSSILGLCSCFELFS